MPANHVWVTNRRLEAGLSDLDSEWCARLGGIAQWVERQYVRMSKERRPGEMLAVEFGSQYRQDRVVLSIPGGKASVKVQSYNYRIDSKFLLTRHFFGKELLTLALDESGRIGEGNLLRFFGVLGTRRSQVYHQYVCVKRHKSKASLRVIEMIPAHG
ncbi:hypothetical protein BD410DRAFT_883220 [Rickenella mellea]|uniref:Uncharacterized protein n=1 Tax=Rickenella mellea TaxID=50990 RepID=A0A4Y7PR66_9AGAM|nr:hypothetical protein BD410DRAFT_883220 [Rickenella mellea]